MIQKADISCLSIRLGMFLLLISVSLSLSAQEDSTHMINDSIHTSSEPHLSFFHPIRLWREPLILCIRPMRIHTTYESST